MMPHILPVLVAGLSGIGTFVVLGSLLYSEKTPKAVTREPIRVAPVIRSEPVQTVLPVMAVPALPKRNGNNKNKKKKQRKADAADGSPRKQIGHAQPLEVEP